MPDPKQIPFLLNLLDDDSDVVQGEISRALNAYGESLKTELARLALPPNPQQRRLLQNLMQEHSRAWLKANWRAWMDEPNEVLALEKAMSALSEFQTGFIFPTDLSILLDDLAALVKEKAPDCDARELAICLFKDLGIAGAQADYNNPLNSGMVYVIKEKRGIPLSLACVYILVGARLGLHVEGCNFPGHFLARVVENGEVYLVDCFNAGAVVDHKVVAQMSEQTPWAIQNLIQYPAPTRVIVARALGNLMKAYAEVKQEENVSLMMDLSEMLEADTRRRALAAAGSQAQNSENSGDIMLAVPSPSEIQPWPDFRTGDIVASAELNWRGVIVDFDLTCKAPEAWYTAHGLGASKDQPWYHIFIDGTQQVGYAAQDRLSMDLSGEKVFHPLVPHFFDKFENGKFTRNQRPWPGTL
jgi:hemimethylated DNA binding protein